MDENHINEADSITSPDNNGPRMSVPGWLKVGVVAAASALAGGLAAAWYYRNTLKILQEAESSVVNPEFRIPDDGTDNDI